MQRSPVISVSGSPSRLLLAAGLALLCAVVGGAAGAEDPLPAQRIEFRQAMASLSGSGPGPASTADSPQLQRYALYPYVQAARLEQALRAAGQTVPATLDEQIATFLRTQGDAPAARDLRRAWLLSLAARASWAPFLDFHQPAGDDAALRCHGFSARIALGRETGLAAPVRQAWLTPRSQPECERAFAWLETSGALDHALITQRVRLALEAGNAGFARQIAARLPADQAAPLLQWAALLENPRRELDALIAAPRRKVEPAALLAGWTRFARADRNAARQRFPKLVQARRMDRGAASPLALALALALAWDRHAEALPYFARVEESDFDDNAREWQARAALWAGDWKLAARSIKGMSEGTRRSARWRYWAARATEQEGEAATAQKLYESLLPDDNYYSAMAAARLRRQAMPNPVALPLDAAMLGGLQDQPAFTRARELLLAGLAEKARVEWRLGQDQLPPLARPQAIHLAARWGWYHQAVAVATGEQVFNDYALLYPRPYDAEVAAAAEVSGLPAPLIYGVIRQESLYRSDALSSAGARGLMQLLPETARRTARQWGRPAPTPDSLFDPAVNVMLGAAHLKDLLARFDGQCHWHWRGTTPDREPRSAGCPSGRWTRTSGSRTFPTTRRAPTCSASSGTRWCSAGCPASRRRTPAAGSRR
ncbi:MAG: transglycosylase SLT domain-containing protein [Pseudomonadota bacterium]|nr:transglycosylase SLT domain-containing protein [Pseudomonadota bacterium]